MRRHIFSLKKKIHWYNLKVLIPYFSFEWCIFNLTGMIICTDLNKRNFSLSTFLLWTSLLFVSFHHYLILTKTTHSRCQAGRLATAQDDLPRCLSPQILAFPADSAADLRIALRDTRRLTQPKESQGPAHPTLGGAWFSGHTGSARGAGNQPSSPPLEEIHPASPPAPRLPTRQALMLMRKHVHHAPSDSACVLESSPRSSVASSFQFRLRGGGEKRGTCGCRSLPPSPMAAYSAAWALVPSPASTSCGTCLRD